MTTSTSSSSTWANFSGVLLMAATASVIPLGVPRGKSRYQESLLTSMKPWEVQLEGFHGSGAVLFGTIEFQQLRTIVNFARRLSQDIQDSPPEFEKVFMENLAYLFA